MSQGKMFEKFQSFLKDPTIKVVSFDIFDTLTFRICKDPQEVFYILGKQKEVKEFFDSPWAFANYRLAAEKNARRENNKEEVTLDDIYKKMPIPSKKRDIFKNLELKVENSLLVPNLQLQKWVDLAYDAKKEIVCISDMYLGKADIMSIALSKFENIHKIKKVYMSCQYNKTKATGKLFLHVLDELKISPHELLHIGDNERIDIAIPNDFGIHTLYYGFDSQTKKMLDYEDSFIQDLKHKGHHVRRISLINNPYKNGELKNFYYRLGAGIFGPILWEYSHWLAQIVNRFELSSLFFIMREGGIFAKYFSKLYPEIKAKLLYASRKSTHFVNLNPQDIGSLNPNTFQGLSLGDLYESFFLDLKKSPLYIYKDTPFESLNTIYLGDKTLLQLVQKEISSNQNSITQSFKKQMSYLQNYLDSLHVNPSSAIVEFGGGGTVLKQLSKAFERSQQPKLSILFYQTKRGYENLSDCHVLSFLRYDPKSAKRLESIARTPNFIEILLNGSCPTTQSYTPNGAKTKAITCNSKILSTIQSSFEQGIDTFFYYAKKFNLPVSTYSKKYLAMLLSRLVDLPTLDEVKWLGDLEYDEGKGSTYEFKLIDDKQKENIKKEGIQSFYVKFLENSAYKKTQIPWPQGVITSLDEKFLTRFYRLNRGGNDEVISSLLQQVDRQNIKNAIIYGAGELCAMLLPHLIKRSVSIEAIVDSRAEIKEFQAHGYEIKSLKSVLYGKKRAVVIVASGVFAQNIFYKLKEFSEQEGIELHIISFWKD